MIFNGVDFDQYEWLKVEKVYPAEGLGFTNRWWAPIGAEARLAEVQMTTYDRKVDIRILGKTREESFSYRGLLMSLLITTDIKLLQFKSETTYEKAKLESAEISDYLLGTLPITLTFKCPYGRAFGSTKNAVIGTNTNVNISGVFEIYPKFEIVNYGPTILITNSTKGKHFQVNSTGVTSTINADFEKMNVHSGLNNLRNMVSLESDYFAVSPGANIISYTGSGTCTMSWTENW